MTTSSRNWFAAARKFALTGAAALLLAACTGGGDDTGPAGPTGPEGPPGGGVPPGAVGSATALQARINRAIVGQTVARSSMSSLPTNRPPADGLAGRQHPLRPGPARAGREWQVEHVARAHAPDRGVPRFAGADAGRQGHGHGPDEPGLHRDRDLRHLGRQRERHLRVHVRQNVKTDAEIPYDPSLPHRVGLEIRTSPNVAPTNIPANNATYTFVRRRAPSSSSRAAKSSTTTPATPATTTWCSTATRASTSSTARCATSRIRSMRSRATRSTSRS